MRKLLSTAAILVLSGLLVGCPGGNGKTAKTGAKTGAAKTGEPAKTGDEGDGDGETAKTEAPPAEAKKVDISHVKEGQVYVYEGKMAGNDMSYKYKVVGVSDTAVEYEMITVMMGNETNAGKQKWEIPAAPATDAKPDPNAPKVEMKDETVEAAGQKWECKMVESSGTKTWVPYKGGMATFPPFIKQEGAHGSMALTKVE